MTTEEVERMVAEQMKNLPPWWKKEAAKADREVETTIKKFGVKSRRGRSEVYERKKR